MIKNKENYDRPFNSFSGLFDQNNGAMDSQINSINLHYKFIINNLKWFANVDQFMQDLIWCILNLFLIKLDTLAEEISFGLKYSVNDFWKLILSITLRVLLLKVCKKILNLN